MGPLDDELQRAAGDARAEARAFEAELRRHEEREREVRRVLCDGIEALGARVRDGMATRDLAYALRQAGAEWRCLARDGDGNLRRVLRRACEAMGDRVRIRDYERVPIVRLAEVLEGAATDLKRLTELREASIKSLDARVEELRRNGARTTLEITREGLRTYGTPPPGEGTHPLQGHRDSMG